MFFCCLKKKRNALVDRDGVMTSTRHGLPGQPSGIDGIKALRLSSSMLLG